MNCLAYHSENKSYVSNSFAYYKDIFCMIFDSDAPSKHSKGPSTVDDALTFNFSSFINPLPNMIFFSLSCPSRRKRNHQSNQHLPSFQSVRKRRRRRRRCKKKKRVKSLSPRLPYDLYLPRPLHVHEELDFAIGLTTTAPFQNTARNCNKHIHSTLSLTLI